MKLLKSLSFLSLPILTVSFAHAFENDWGQWQDDSFDIQSVESINQDIQDSVNVQRQNNKKDSKTSSQTISDSNYDESEITALSEPEIIEKNQKNDDIQYVESDITDYENKDRFATNQTLLNQPLEVEISELENNIEYAEFETEYDNIEQNGSYEQTKFRENIEAPEFDYQDYEYNKEIEETSPSVPESTVSSS